MEVLASLFTILIIVLLGISSRKFSIFKAEHAKTLSSFVYYFGLPALFFDKISHLDLHSGPRIVAIVDQEDIAGRRLDVPLGLPSSRPSRTAGGWKHPS